MKPIVGDGVASTTNDTAYPLFPQEAEYATSEELTTLSDANPDVSLPLILARSSPGTAMAAMTLMIAMTINSSINVKPSSPLPVMTKNSLLYLAAPTAPT